MCKCALLTCKHTMFICATNQFVSESCEICFSLLYSSLWNASCSRRSFSLTSITDLFLLSPQIKSMIHYGAVAVMTLCIFIQRGGVLAAGQ